MLIINNIEISSIKIPELDFPTPGGMLNLYSSSLILFSLCFVTACKFV